MEREFCFIKRNTFVFILFLFVGCIIYANSLNVPFVFDDIKNIQNPAVELNTLSWEALHAAFFDGFLKTRPISNFSFALNYYVGGYRVQGFHLVNIFIHVFAAYFLFLFIFETLSLPINRDRYKNAYWLAFSASLIWLVHPLATQSVTYIVQRMSSMSAMFYIISMYCYVRARRVQTDHNCGFAYSPNILLGLSIISGLLAIGSKENAVMLPFVIFLYEWLFFQNLSWTWLKKKIIWIVLLLCLLIVAGYFHKGVSIFHLFTCDCPSRDFTAFQRFLTEPRVIIRYLSLLFYPAPGRMALDYLVPFSRSLFSPPSTLWAAGFLVLVLAGAIAFCRRERVLSFCIFWFLANLVIESSFICLELYYEHRTYLPSMLFWLLFVGVLYRTRLDRRFLISLLGIAVVLFGIRTVQRNSDWQSGITLWQSNIGVCPANPRPYSNLGNLYVDNKMYAEAEQAYNQSLKIAPTSVIPQTNLGSVYMAEGRYEEAEQCFEKAVHIDKNSVAAWSLFGKLKHEMQEYAEASRLFQRALNIDPGHQVADKKSLAGNLNKWLGDSLLRSGDPAASLEYLQKASAILPEDEDVLHDLGEAYTLLGKGPEAEKKFEEAISIDPDKLSARFNLALLYQQTGRNDKALKEYEYVVRNLRIPEGLYYNYANALSRAGKYRQAEDAYKKTLDEVPLIVQACNNLGILMVKQQRFQEAVSHFSYAVQIAPDFQLARDNLQRAQKDLERQTMNEKKQKGN